MNVTIYKGQDYVMTKSLYNRAYIQLFICTLHNSKFLSVFDYFIQTVYNLIEIKFNSDFGLRCDLHVRVMSTQHVQVTLHITETLNE